MPANATARNHEIDPTQASWLPGFLSFADDSGLVVLKQQFTLLLAERLGERIALLSHSNDKNYVDFNERLTELPADRFLRILLAPESVHRLLWPELHQPADIGRFIARAVEAERALCGLDSRLVSASWTALGDAWCGSASRVRVVKMPEFPPIVLGDPSTRHPLAAAPGNLSGEEHQLSEGSLDLVKARLSETRELLKATDPIFWAFARDFNVTLVLRRTDGERAGFRSSSPERYVGRSILWNPDLPNVTVADLAEAMIHEAIHTVLDSTDALISRVISAGTRWVTDPALYDGVSRSTSPWTGRPLDVPTYVHAFFVWYGLLCFWSRAWLSKSFDADIARQRMIRAGAPFINEVALTPLENFNDFIRPDILEVLRSIQAEVSLQFKRIARESNK